MNDLIDLFSSCTEDVELEIMNPFCPARRAKNPVFMRVQEIVFLRLGYRIVPQIKIWGTKGVQTRKFYPTTRVLKAKKEPPSRQLFFGINPVFMRVCNPYLFASSTATAQATVSPTMGLLSLWNQVYPVISIFSYSVLSWLVLRRKIAFTLASHIDILLIFPMFFKVIFIRGWQNVSTLIYITSFSRPDTAAGYVSGSSDPFLHIPLKMFR